MHRRGRVASMWLLSVRVCATFARGVYQRGRARLGRNTWHCCERPMVGGGCTCAILPVSIAFIYLRQQQSSLDTRIHQRKSRRRPKVSPGSPHPSTDRALCCLTSEVERDPVHSTRYGRRRKHCASAHGWFLDCGLFPVHVIRWLSRVGPTLHARPAMKQPTAP